MPCSSSGRRHSTCSGTERIDRDFSSVTCCRTARDGASPRVFTPRRKPSGIRSSEEMNNWLLVNPGVPGPTCHAEPPRRATEGRDGLLRRRDRADLRRAGLRPDPPLQLSSASVFRLLVHCVNPLGDDRRRHTVPRRFWWLSRAEQEELLGATAQVEGLGTDLVVQNHVSRY